MNDKKFVPFDYQRYLDGEKVFTKDGYEVKQLTRFYDLPDIPSPGDSHCMVGNIGKMIIFSDARGYFQGEPFLKMLPKTKKLWIAVSKDGTSGNHDTSLAYPRQKDLHAAWNIAEEDFCVLEIEIEV